jgi:putative oxidoreductase
MADATTHLATLVLDPGPVDRWSGLARIGGGLVLLAGRLWLGWSFLSSGLTRIAHWDSQGFLFSSVHPVPFLPPDWAPALTTGAELVLPPALILGFLARPAAFGLAIMAATIYFVIGQTPEGIENGIAVASEQFPWMAVGLAIAVVGAGPLSIDAVAKRAFKGRSLIG